MGVVMRMSEFFLDPPLSFRIVAYFYSSRLDDVQNTWSSSSFENFFAQSTFITIESGRLLIARFHLPVLSLCEVCIKKNNCCSICC